MANKKTQRLDDDFDFGDVGDFDFGDMDSEFSADSKKSSKSRSAVTEVFSGTISGAKSKLTDIEELGKAVRNSLPKSYDYFMESANDVAGTMSKAYQDAARELKPEVAKIATTVNRLVPDSLKGIKSLTKKFDDFINSGNFEYKSPSRAEIENQLVNNTLSDVFKLQAEKEDKQRAEDKANQRIRDVFEHNRNKVLVGLLGRIEESVSKSSSITENIGIGYMKKSLELQVRQLFTIQNLTEKTIRYQEASVKQHEAIVKNTALPEFVKIKASEKFKELAANKFYGSFQSTFMEATGLSKIASSVAEDFKQYVEGIKMGLSATGDGLEMIQEQLEQIEELRESGLNVSKAELLGQMLGGMGANKVKEFLASAVQEALSQDERVDKFGVKASTIALNPAAYAKRFRGTDEYQDNLFVGGPKGKLMNVIDYLLSKARDEHADFKLRDANTSAKLSDPGVITNKFIRSVEEVIPSWLAHIHKELVMTRTGSDKDIGLSRFDFSKGKIVSNYDASVAIKERLRYEKGDAVNRGYSDAVDATIKELIGEDAIPGDIDREIRRFIMHVSREPNTVYDSEGLKGSKAYEGLSDKGKEYLDKYLNSVRTGDDSIDKARRELKLTESFMNTRRRTTDIRSSIEDLLLNYGEDALTQEGLVKRDKAGNLVIDEGSYNALIDQGYFYSSTREATSDKNKKTGIRGIFSRFGKSDINTKENITTPDGSFLEKIRKTGIFSWFYKEGEGDSEEHIGPMAQDVKKNMGDRVAPNGRKIDLVNLNGINMAATQELADKVDGLIGPDGSLIGYAALTADNTAKIADLLENKTFFSIPLPEGVDIKEILKGSGSILSKIFGGAKDIGATTVKTGARITKGAVTGAFNAGVGVLDWMKDVFVDPSLDFLKDEETKKAITSGIGSVFKGAFSLGSFVLGQARKTLTERIPAAITGIKNTVKGFLDTVYDGIIGVPDLYIKGRIEPVILAARLRAGDYIDSATGKVLTSLRDIESVRGDIVNKAGEVIVTSSEVAQGFFDRYGKVVKRKMLNGLQTGLALAGGVGRLALKAASGIGRRVGAALGITDGRFDSLKEAMSDAFKDMNFGFMSPEANTAIVDVRDLLYRVYPKEAADVEANKAKARGDLTKRGKGIMAAIKDFLRGKKSDVEDSPVHKLFTEQEPSSDAESLSEGSTGTSSQVSTRGGLGILGKGLAAINNNKGKIAEGAAKVFNKLPGSGRLKTVATKAGNVFNKTPGSGKMKALGGLLKSGAGSLLNFGASLFGGSGDSSQEPQNVVQEDKDTLPSEQRSFKASTKGKSVNKNILGAFNDRNNDGRRDGSYEDRVEAYNKEKEERLRKKALKKDAAKYRGANVLDRVFKLFADNFGKIATAAGALFSSLIGGPKSLIGKALSYLGIDIAGSGTGVKGTVASKGKGPATKVKGTIRTSGKIGVLGKLKGLVGLGGKTAPVAKAATKAGMLRTAGSGIKSFGRGVMGKLPGLATAITVGQGAMDVYASESSNMSRTEKDEATGRAVGSTAGTLAGMSMGAKAGAALGTIAGPIGTVAGGIIGGAAGAFFGGQAGDIVGEKIGNFVSYLRDMDIPGKFSEAADYLKSGFDTVKSKLSGAWESITEATGSFMSDAAAKASSMLDSVSGKVAAGVAAVTKPGRKLIGGAVSKTGKLLKGTFNGIRSIGTGTMNLASKIPGAGLVGKLGRGLKYGTIGAGVLTGTPALAGIGTAAGSAVSSPFIVGAAAVAGVGYGAYKLYKYLTRNKANDFELVRLYQYGIGHTEESKRYISNVLALESYLLDGRTGYSATKTWLLDKLINKKDVLELLGVDPEDKEKVANFEQWFNYRFTPVYLHHTKALYDLDKKTTLDKIDTIDNKLIIQYLDKADFSSAPYSEYYSPFKALDALNTDPQYSKIIVHNLLVKYTDPKSKEKLALPMKATTVDEQLKARAALDEAKRNVSDSTAKQQSRITPSTNRSLQTSLNLSQGEGDGPSRDLGIASAQQSDQTQTVQYSPSSLPQATGDLRDGSGAGAFVVFNKKDVKIDSMNPVMRQRLLGMIQEYGEMTGKKVIITSGTRTSAEQAELFKRHPGKAARPGRSLHEFGLAVDINTADVNAMDSMGLMRKYGFTRPVGGETWHVEPIGIQGQIGIAKNDPNAASSMVAAGAGYGGGGIGSIKGSKMGRRDPKASFAVMQASSSVAKNDNGENNLLPSQPGLIKDTKDSKETRITTAGTSTPTSNSSIILTSYKDSFNGSEANGTATVSSNVADSIDEPSPSISTSSTKSTGVEGAIEEGAKKVGVDPSMMKAFAAIESSMNPNAKAPNTSASGLYQFVNGTWNEQVKKNASKYGLGSNPSRFDPYASTVLAGGYLKANLNTISKIKSNPNIVDAYLTHFLGPGGARTFLSADPNSIAAQVLPSAAKSNRSIFYNGSQPRTIAQVYQLLKDRIYAKAKSFGISLPSISGLTSTGKSSADKDAGIGISAGNTSPASSPMPATSPINNRAASSGSSSLVNTASNSFSRIDPRSDTSMVNTSTDPSRTGSAVESQLSHLVDINAQQLTVFTQMLQFLQTEIPKLVNKDSSSNSGISIPRIQDVKAKAETAAAVTPVVSKPQTALPQPAVNLGRRPFTA